MKKAVLIVMTVAVLGAIGLYINKSPSTSNSGYTNQAVAGVNTTASNQNSSSSSSTDSTSSSSSSSGSYKDGTFTGVASDTPYGSVQIAVVVSGGKITDVNFLQMPSDQGNSRVVTSFAEPQLKQETLSAQSAHIDFVSGATSTSYGYEDSLQSALDKAKIS